MAEVSYKHEPTVTVHGVPKTQYDQGTAQVGTGGMNNGGVPSSGIGADIKAHPIWALSIGIGVIAILIMIYLWWQGQSGASSNTSNAIDPNTGVPYALENGSNPAATSSSQIEADMQQMQSFQDQLLGILQQIQSGNLGTGGTTTTPPPPTGGTTTPPPGGGVQPPGGGTKPKHLQGSDFLGPTGVMHYVATGNETLSQISSEFGSGTWNSIYAIPDNQKLFGKLNSSQAKSYKPRAGTVITLSPNTSTSAGSYWASHSG